MRYEVTLTERDLQALVATYRFFSSIDKKNHYEDDIRALNRIIKKCAWKKEEIRLFEKWKKESLE